MPDPRPINPDPNKGPVIPCDEPVEPEPEEDEETD